MKIVTKKNLLFKEAGREYKASTHLTKTDNARLQAQINDFQSRGSYAKQPRTSTAKHQDNAAHLKGDEGSSGDNIERRGPPDLGEGGKRRDAKENP